MDLRAVVPGRTFAFPADHGPHPEFRIEWWYVTANLADAQWRGLWRAMDAVSSGDRGGRRRRKAGPTSRSGWAMPPSPAPIRIASPRRSRAAGSARPASTQSRFAPGSMPGRCAGSIASTTTISRRCELNASGADFSYALRLDAGPPAGAAGRRRLQPEIAARTGLLLLQPAALYGEGRPYHRRQAGRGDRTGLARSRVEQPAAGIGSKRMGLALAAFQRRRQADAVPDAPDRRQALRLRQMDRARRQDRTARLRRHRR